MKLEFEKFDIENFDKSEDWSGNCVFITKTGMFVEGSIVSINGDIYYNYLNIFDGNIYEPKNTPKYYMFKD